MGPYPRGCWQRSTVFLEAPKAGASESHWGWGWSELGCWGTQAYGFPVTGRGTKEWWQQRWWLPSPGRQLRGQGPPYREKEVLAPNLKGPIFWGSWASARTGTSRYAVGTAESPLSTSPPRILPATLGGGGPNDGWGH